MVAVDYAIKKSAIPEDCRPYDSADNDRSDPRVVSPVRLGSKLEADVEDDAEIGAMSLGSGATDRENTDSETYYDNDFEV